MGAITGKKRLLTISGIAAAVLIIAALAIIIAAALLFYRYRTAGPPAPVTPAGQIVITQPQNMAAMPARNPLDVRVSTSGSTPINSAELWINGKLEGVQAAPAGGATSFSAVFA